MTGTGRWIIAVSGVVLAVPAMFGLYSIVDISLRYSRILEGGSTRLSGAGGIEITRWVARVGAPGGLSLFPFECLGVLLHFVAFVVLLAQFVRQTTLSVALQIYCLLVVDLAVLELLRREWCAEDTFYWFGPLSGVHAAFLVVWLGSLALIERRRGKRARV